MYSILRTNLSEKNTCVRATVINMDEVMNYQPTLGKPWGNDFPLLKIKLDTKEPPSDLFETGPFWIASLTIKNILETIKCNTEFHMISLFTKNNEAIKKDYFILNVLDICDCIDYENSIFESDEDYIDQIEKLVIDDSTLNNKNILRVDKTYDSIILVSDTLKELLNKNKISGVEFVNPEKFSN